MEIKRHDITQIQIYFIIFIFPYISIFTLLLIDYVCTWLIVSTISGTCCVHPFFETKASMTPEIREGFSSRELHALLRLPSGNLA